MLDWDGFRKPTRSTHQGVGMDPKVEGYLTQLVDVDRGTVGGIWLMRTGLVRSVWAACRSLVRYRHGRWIPKVRRHALQQQVTTNYWLNLQPRCHGTGDRSLQFTLRPSDA